MRCFVTGGTGFVGANLVNELCHQGHEVVVLVRPQSDLVTLEGLPCEKVVGSLEEVGALKRAMLGCQWCFHVAASYHLWLPDYRPMYEANVGGTRRVIEMAMEAGCERIVYTSTVGCIGLPKAKDGTYCPTNETDVLDGAQLTNHYKRSKWQAEQVALEFARDGAPLVVVNPSTPIGPRDAKPTPTGKVVLDFLNRELPGYLETGLNWVHVRDVAIGHILAAERGRVGERYILGNAQGNLRMLDALKILEEITGLKAPRLRVPYPAAWAAAVISEGLAKLTGVPPKAPMAGVRMAKYWMWFDPGKAIRELNMPQTPVSEAFSDAVDWFRENGYVRT